MEESSAAKLTIKGATLVNEKVNAFGYGIVGETFHEPTVVLKEGETVLWFADAAHTTPFDFTKAIENTDAVTVYAVILKEGQTLEDVQSTASSTEASFTETEASEMDQNRDESIPESFGILTAVMIAAILIVIAVAILAIAFVLKKKRS